MSSVEEKNQKEKEEEEELSKFLQDDEYEEKKRENALIEEFGYNNIYQNMLDSLLLGEEDLNKTTLFTINNTCITIQVYDNNSKKKEEVTNCILFSLNRLMKEKYLISFEQQGLFNGNTYPLSETLTLYVYWIHCCTTFKLTNEKDK